MKTQNQHSDNQDALSCVQTHVSKSAFLEGFSEHIYFKNQKVISMFTELENRIEKTKSKMFELNNYSNISTIKNTELMLKNYLVFIFILENIHFLEQKELEMFLNILKWENDNFILDFYDFGFLKTLYFHCSGYDFSDKQTILFDAEC